MDNTPLVDGVTVDQTADYLLIRSERPLRVLSSAVLGADLEYTRHVLSVRVPLHYESARPEDDILERAEALGIAEPFVGMLTAVDLRRVVVQVATEDDLRVAAVVTVGVGNATAAGSVARRIYSASDAGHTGTINMVLVIDGDMSSGAMVNAVITATEAKTLALVRANVRTLDGELASGTSSDAIVVACTGRGRAARYAGPATTLGLLIGRTVRVAVGLGLETALAGN